jgi:N-methylhydantoinase A
MGVRRVICPLGAGVASAFGFLASPISFEFARAVIEPLAGLDLARIDKMVSELEAEGMELVTSAGIAAADATTSVGVLMRYSGQGYQVEVTIPRDVISNGDKDQIQTLFEDRYLALFGRTERMAAEIMSWRVVVAGPKPVIEPQAALRPGTALIGQRPVYFGETGDFVDTPVYDRYCLPPDQTIAGPAVFEERESTIVMPPAANARADLHGNLIIELDP